MRPPGYLRQAAKLNKLMKKLLAKIMTKLSPSIANQKYMEKAILDRDNFIKLIQQERDRAHRTHRQFSLVIISVNGNNNANVSVTANISKRVRRIDRIGWYDDSHIGVLLPNTTYAGAQVFLKDISKNNEETTGNMDTAIMSYPENSSTSSRRPRPGTSR
jgi:hypothetical protein